MAETGFDTVIHSPARLRVCGLLSRAEAVRFEVLRQTLGMSDATMSKQLKVLSDAGYVTTSRLPSSQRADARRIVWVSLTDKGRQAFAGHVRALQEIVGAQPPGPGDQE